MTDSPNRRLRRQSCRKFLGDFYAVIIYAIFYIPVLVMMVFSLCPLWCRRSCWPWPC